MIAALQLTDIAVRFGGVQAVDGVSLVIEAGQFVGLIGPNGAGKTTLIRIVAGAVRADRGRVLLGGTDITDMRTASRIRKGMALTHQMVRPFREVTALDNVALAAGYLRTSSPLRAILHVRQNRERERAADIMVQVGLGGVGSKLAGSLPLGQMKRLEVARALAVEPKLIVCDEVVSALDVSVQAQIVNLLQDLQDELGLSYLFISHDLAVVEHISHDVVVMFRGQIVERADAVSIYTHPQHDYTRNLLASVPSLS